MENANFEFFILGTSSDATLPSFDSIDSSKNQLRVINFRTLKIYNMPLKRAYEFVMRFVRFAPALAYPEKVMKMVRRCAIETIRNPPMDPTFRKDYERRLHAMLIFDLRKLSLHLCVDLAKTISRMAAADPAVLVCNDSHFFTSLMVQSMERVFNNSSTISGLTPPVNAVLPWVRQDAPAAPAIRNVVDDIFAKCVRNKQFVHFIRLEENDAAGVSRLGHAGYTKPWESRYGHPVMSLQDVHSFMHHLHQRFSFRSSFVLEAPEQLLPKNPKLSANTPRNNCNPFDEYYWQSKNSCLIVNTIESVIGYHEVYSRGYSTNSSEGFVHGKTKAKKANLFQYLAADVGGNSGLSSSRTNANSNSEGTVSLRKTGVNGRASIGNGKVFGLDGGVSKGWMVWR